ncbi:hypothetical protein LRH25_12635 [Ideonella azotifigens]|uniref:Lipase helper protein n=1 Tax=Ideonella azotifigens TaxID=513160 RepID=A0ABN1JWL3_9BURK|nr:lipase secretion chaperone [Ideonella azotifigens]MCD2341187.1 hypothetical protein [Ideonella azotifigens]
MASTLRRPLVAGLLAAGAGAALVLALHAGQDGAGAVLAGTRQDSTAPLRVAPNSPVPLADAASGAPRSIEALQQALYVQGPLRNSQPDGGWTVDGGGTLKPDIGLRRRFDHLLSAMGDASLPELGLLLQDQAGRELPPAAVAEVMRLWQRYLDLQQRSFAHNADLRDVSTWQPALDERMRVRRELLGPAWADAFYADEEAQLRSHIASRTGQPGSVADNDSPADLRVPDVARPPRPGEDPQLVFQRRQAALGLEAAQRLQQLDEEETRWASRIAQARAQVQSLSQAPELSAPQRSEAIARYVESNFSADERLRAQAVLGLNPVR